MRLEAIAAGGAFALFLYFLRKEVQLREGEARYLPLVRQIAAEEGVPFEILAGVVRAESSWSNSPNWRSSGCKVACVASSACAVGLAQVLPSTAADMGVTGDLCDPANSLRAGARYLKRMFSKYNDWQTALTAYNWGPGHMDRALAAGVAPKSDSVAYANKVLGAGSRYVGLAGINLLRL